MKVLLINGSPHREGCTYTALREVAGELEAQDIRTHILHIGSSPVQDCTGCRKCAQLGRCVFDSDPVNQCAELLKECDGLVVGSPVYYAGPCGAVCSFLNRLFYPMDSKWTARKPAAAVVSCRRGGASAAFDRLNKYFTISQMPVVSSQYWNAVHGNTPEEVGKDLEGLQIMRTLGRNMAWMLQSHSAGAVPPPDMESRVRTNFIR